ncbi:MAG: prepilin-type N-terminal cleavage/methylation domain-containing protein [Candidatus Gracilibacteria bacterium]|jgi:general secretion pathway protein G|nr:prepilin-type N-terminal cleavage/methylation domain-containing protein [Candidatus Gracilibacteria bacterium]
MKKNLLSKKGFTLIELLVVITIIGILATGASTVYVSAQQKARDSIRQTDLTALKGAIEQAYTDTGKYLSSAAAATAGSIKNTTDGIKAKGYIAEFPADPKSTEADAQTQFIYIYGAKDAANGIAGQLYEFSANFENSSNATREDEGGDDANRWEIGVDIANVTTTSSTSAITGTNDYAGTSTNAIAVD